MTRSYCPPTDTDHLQSGESLCENLATFPDPSMSQQCLGFPQGKRQAIRTEISTTLPEEMYLFGKSLDEFMPKGHFQKQWRPQWLAIKRGLLAPPYEQQQVRGRPTRRLTERTRIRRSLWDTTHHPWFRRVWADARLQSGIIKVKSKVDLRAFPKLDIDPLAKGLEPSYLKRLKSNLTKHGLKNTLL